MNGLSAARGSSGSSGNSISRQATQVQQQTGLAGGVSSATAVGTPSASEVVQTVSRVTNVDNNLAATTRDGAALVKAAVAGDNGVSAA